MIALAAALVPLLGAAAFLFAEGRRRALAVLLAAAAAEVLLALASFSGATETPVRLAGGYFVSDPASRLFLALTAIVFLGIVLYVRNRAVVAPALLPDVARFAVLALLFMGATSLAITSNHLVLGWVFIEATTLVAVPLIALQRSEASARAAWRYLLFSTVGLSLTFLGLACLARSLEGHVPGTHEVSFLIEDLETRVEHAAPFWRRLGLLLMIFGYGTKIGLAPMYGWLPEAYDAAPPSVTAMLSAIQSSTVFLAICRVLQVYRQADGELVSYELVAMGLASMLVSTAHIVGAKNYKRLIAFAAMTHNGIVAVGLGTGKVAAYGVVVYLVSNALVKALLFLTCGNIKARYRTKATADLTGLIGEMPASGLFFMVGTFALLGFAPFGSFVGEVMIFSGLIEGRHTIVFLVFCVLLTIILVSIGRSIFPMIWGERHPERKVHAKGESLGSLAPNLLFLTLLVSLGLYIPEPMTRLFQQVAAEVAGK